MVVVGELVALASSLVAGELVALGTMVASDVQHCLCQWVVLLPSIWVMPSCAGVLLPSLWVLLALLCANTRLL